MHGHQPLAPKPPSTPRNNLHYNYSKKLNNDNDKNSDNLEKILKSTPSPRPLSASLSRFQTLPKIGTKPEQKYLIAFRFPDGSRIQGHFNKDDKVSILLEYAFKEYSSKVESKIDFKDFALIQMPSLILSELDRTIYSYEIKDKSMLFLVSKDQVI